MTDFSTILSSEFKQTFNDAIDAVLAQTGLTVQCILSYAGQKNTEVCNNCIYDPISKLSANLYNGTGSSPFPDNSICPVCLGMGQKDSDAITEKVFLAVLFDSKYWLNWSSKTMNIPDGMIQTICNVNLLPKIRAASDITIDPALAVYGNYTYERAGDPMPVGLGSNRYIITMWTRK
jgi:hypothetical protein